jgi:hypothetical protein
MKHVDNVTAFRSAQQAEHGVRVEHRQAVNGQPNGYRSISEAELQEQRSAPSKTYKPTHGGYCA